MQLCESSGATKVADKMESGATKERLVSGKVSFFLGGSASVASKTVEVTVEVTSTAHFHIKDCNDIMGLPLELVESSLKLLLHSVDLQREVPGARAAVESAKGGYLQREVFMRLLSGLFKLYRVQKAVKFWAIETAQQLYRDDFQAFANETVAPLCQAASHKVAFQAEALDKLFDAAKADSGGIMGFLGSIRKDWDFLFDISSRKFGDLAKFYTPDICTMSVKGRHQGKTAKVTPEEDSPDNPSPNWYKDALWVYLWTESPDFHRAGHPSFSVKERQLQPTSHTELAIPKLDAELRTLFRKEYRVPPGPSPLNQLVRWVPSN